MSATPTTWSSGHDALTPLHGRLCERAAFTTEPERDRRGNPRLTYERSSARVLALRLAMLAKVRTARSGCASCALHSMKRIGLRTGAHRLGNHAGDRAAAQSRGDRVIGAVGRECQAWTASRCSRSVVLRGIGLELQRIGHATFGRSQAHDIGGPRPRRRVAHLRLTDVAGERVRIVGQVAVEVRGQGRRGGPRSHVPTQCDFRRRASSRRLRGASSRCCAR